MLTWNFSWHYGEVKEVAIQQGFSVPDEAAIRKRVFGKTVAPELATVKDFLRFHTATSQGKIKEKITSDSLNTFTELFFVGFSCITRYGTVLAGVSHACSIAMAI